MKIVILNPKDDFTFPQQEQLAKAGEVVYMNPPGITEHPMEELVDLCKDANVVAADPDVLGGFEVARERLTQLMDMLPNLRGVSLGTTSYGWIDLDYCKRRNITVSNCPGWSKESVAEQALALIFCLARNIIMLDRAQQKGEYTLKQGIELKGKTLGIIGVGSIGSTLANLARGIGMKVIGYNHSPKIIEGIGMKRSLDELLAEADAISIHVTHRDENINLLGKEQLEKLKEGVIIVNVASRDNVNEEEMAKALKSGQVAGYAYEGEDLENTPLKGIENAIGLKPFAWYTKEAIKNLFQVWTDTIVSIADNNPQNVVSE